jgi:hypothetical protein
VGAGVVAIWSESLVAHFPECASMACLVRKETGMHQRNYSRLAAVIFAIIPLLQLLRTLLAWEITLNGVAIPLYVSAMACFIAAVYGVTWLWRVAQVVRCRRWVATARKSRLTVALLADYFDFNARKATAYHP